MRFIFLTILTFVCSTIFAEDTWLYSLEEAQEVAQREGKLILLKLKESRCNECIKMDFDVWKKEKTKMLVDGFVAVEINIDLNPNVTSFYDVKVAPSFMILDAFANKIFSMSSYQKQEVVMRVLASFPTEVKELNVAFFLLHTNKKNRLANLSIGEICQNYANSLKNDGFRVFSSLSDQYYNKARRLCKNQNDQLILDKIELLKSWNFIIRGQSQKGIKKIEDFMASKELADINKVLAYHILISGYLEIGGNQEIIADYRALTKKIKSGRAYMNNLKT